MFREKIKKNYENMSGGYRAIADLFLNDPFEVSFMTASALAKRLNIDTATVVRFAQRLGYDGYPALREEVRAIVRAQVQHAAPPTEEAPGVAAAFRRQLEAERRNLDKLVAELDDASIEKTIAAIGAARRIVLIGQWAMEPLAEFLAWWLQALGKPAQATSADALSASHALLELNAQDVVLALALGRASTEMLATLRAAQASGARLIVFATARSQAAARLADIEIICPAPGDQLLASFGSMALAMAAIFNTLVAVDPQTAEQRAAALNMLYNRLLEGYRPYIPAPQESA